MNIIIFPRDFRAFYSERDVPIKNDRYVIKING